MSNTTNRLTTPEAILSYPQLFEPKAGEQGGKEKYSACFVFGPEADLSAFEKLAYETARGKFGDKFYFEGKDKPVAGGKKLRFPIRVDDEGKYGEPGVMRFINARSDSRPFVVDQQVKPIDEKRSAEIYPGAKVRATLSCFAYDQPQNKGVSFGLGNVQKLADAPRIDSRRSAEQDFEPVTPAELELAQEDLV